MTLICFVCGPNPRCISLILIWRRVLECELTTTESQPGWAEIAKIVSQRGSMLALSGGVNGIIYFEVSLLRGKL